VVGGGVEHLGHVPMFVGIKWADEVGVPFSTALMSRYDLVPQRALGAFVSALVRGQCGNAAQGADEAARHYEATRTQGFLGGFPAATLAEALLRCGRHDAAFELANRVLEGLPSAETGIFVPELWRLRAEARAASGSGHAHEVEHDLRAALRIASVQRAEVFRLRAALALGRLLRDRGRIGDARELVSTQAAAADLDPALDERRALHALATELGL